MKSYRKNGRTNTQQGNQIDRVMDSHYHNLSSRPIRCPICGRMAERFGPYGYKHKKRAYIRGDETTYCKLDNREGK